LEASSTATAQQPSGARSARRPAERFRLTGPSARLDLRVNAVRRDIADLALATHIFAPHYAQPQSCAIAASSAMLREEAAEGARAVSQLLHGEGFAAIDISGGWAWGYGLHDRYVGYVRADLLGEAEPADHIVMAPLAPVFAAPDIKARVAAEWPIGARFAATGEEGNFIACAAGFVHRRHARPIAATEADPVAVATRLLGAPYLWGGRGAGGIDCSGLTQIALEHCGIEAPRDSDQQRMLGREIAAGEALQRGDLVFFPGHVGLMADAANLLHANAYWMAVTIEPLDDVVARLATDHAEPILARRRLV
jgi:hypothetical protein